MELTEQMVAYAAEQVTGSSKIKYGEYELEFKPPWKRLEMRVGILKPAALTLLSIKLPRRYSKP